MCLNANVLYYIYIQILLPLEDLIASVYKTAGIIKIRETYAMRAMTTRTGFIAYLNKTRAAARRFYRNCISKTAARIDIMRPE